MSEEPPERSEKTLKDEAIHDRMSEVVVALRAVLIVHEAQAARLQSLGAAFQALSNLEGFNPTASDLKRAAVRLSGGKSGGSEENGKAVLTGSEG